MRIVVVLVPLFAFFSAFYFPASDASAQARRQAASPEVSAAAPPRGAESSRSRRARDDDDGEGLDIFYLEAMGGVGYVNMRAISYDNLYPEIVELKGSGPSIAFGGGIHLLFLTLGARASISGYDDFDVGTATLDVGLHLPVPVVKPYVHLGVGYGWHGDADYGSPGLSETSVYGYVVEAGLGVNIHLSIFSIGAGMDVDILNMSRQAISITNPTSPTEISLAKDGDAVGVQVRAGVTLGLHL